MSVYMQISFDYTPSIILALKMQQTCFACVVVLKDTLFGQGKYEHTFFAARETNARRDHV